MDKHAIVSFTAEGAELKTQKKSTKLKCTFTEKIGNYRLTDRHWQKYG